MHTEQRVAVPSSTKWHHIQ